MRAGQFAVCAGVLAACAMVGCSDTTTTPTGPASKKDTVTLGATTFTIPNAWVGSTIHGHQIAIGSDGTEVTTIALSFGPTEDCGTLNGALSFGANPLALVQNGKFSATESIPPHPTGPTVTLAITGTFVSDRIVTGTLVGTISGSSSCAVATINDTWTATKLN